MTSWRVVLGKERASNALRFAHEREARAYLHELTGRWLGAPYPHDVEQVDDTVTHTVDECGRAVDLSRS